MPAGKRGNPIKPVYTYRYRAVNGFDPRAPANLIAWADGIIMNVRDKVANPIAPDAQHACRQAQRQRENGQDCE